MADVRHQKDIDSIAFDIPVTLNLILSRLPHPLAQAVSSVWPDGGAGAGGGDCGVGASSRRGLHSQLGPLQITGTRCGGLGGRAVKYSVQRRLMISME